MLRYSRKFIILFCIYILPYPRKHYVKVGFLVYNISEKTTFDLGVEKTIQSSILGGNKH
jgi:hypothetical protein